MSDVPMVAVATPPSIKRNPRLDEWIRLQPDGSVEVFTGKAELGQGILTALSQIVADELDVAIGSIRLVSADTSRGPDEQYTYGSQSVEHSGTALQLAGAQARAIIVEQASHRLAIDQSELKTECGLVIAKDGRQLTYWEAIGGDTALFSRDVILSIAPKPSTMLRIVGTSVPRIDLPAKLTGQASYVQDLRMPGMAFGRIVRPVRIDAALLSVDGTAVQAMPGVIAVIQDGSFLGVVAEREEQAIAARVALAASAQWSEAGSPLPDVEHLTDALRNLRSETTTLIDDVASRAITTKHVEADYSRPYLSQASIGPSCAVALLKDGHLTIWSHTQGVFPLRGDLAKVLDLDTSEVDVIHVPSAGCYGQNGADDVALDASLLARAVAGRSVKLQWMREDEFTWAPVSPAMSMKVGASLAADGTIAEWQYDVWSNAHAMRPGQPGGVNLLAAQHLAKPFHRSPPLRIPQPTGDGDRNAIPMYDLGSRHIRNHLLLDEPIRNGSLRTLGALGNVFAIESFMDELAEAADLDPVTFRIMHLSDPRAIAVLRAAVDKAGWNASDKGDGRKGRGVAFSRYKNVSTYAAVVVDIDVDPQTGRVVVPSAVVAVDVGRIINPDGLTNQIEGGLVQAVSFCIKERVRFDRQRITSRDWIGYPILRFPEVPRVEVVLIDRPDEPALGGGEGSLAPAAAAIANAFANATGHRIRDLPMTPERVSSALDSLK